MKLYIASTLLLLAFLAGCTAENELVDIPTDVKPKRAQVVLTLAVPAASLPTATRAAEITNDKEIKDITLWAFDHRGNFLYQIDERSTTQNGKPQLTIRSNKVYVQLPESSDNVQLSLITNIGTLTAPAEGTPKATALQSIPMYTRSQLTAIPMYGESKPFVVKEGANPGTIKLTRAMAKIEVDATNAWPLFELHTVEVINVNSKGTVLSSTTIANLGNKEVLEKSVGSTPEVNNNLFEAYVPEATGVSDKDLSIRTFVLLYGKNKNGESRYYRLDFIKRTKVTNEAVQYTPVTEIVRNHRYTFHIEHIVPTAGESTREKAINKEIADNGILGASVEVKIIDEEIMDITTDNQYYLGVTSSQLQATLNTDGNYYITNMNVVANYENGWVIDDLPKGVEVSVQKQNSPTYDTDGTILPTSVWIYIDKTIADKKADKKFVIYVYSRNIRKTITITIL